MNELLAVSGDATVQVAMAVTKLQVRMQILTEVARSVLRSGVDYGVIPGTDKPVLLKPGAEKLATVFGLHPDPQLLAQVEDWDSGLFYYRYRVELRADDGSFVGAAEGSANSRERKYRWRTVPEFRASPEEREAAARTETRTGKAGKPYKVLVIENRDPADLVNTLQKMAQKRALIAAVLSCTGASEFYSQDIEELEFVPGGDEGGPAPQEGPAGPTPTQAQKPLPAPKPPAPRPIRDAETMRDMLRRKAGWERGANGQMLPPVHRTYPDPRDTQRIAAVIDQALRHGGLAPNATTAFAQRHSILKHVWGVLSAKDLDAGAVAAMTAAWESREQEWQPNEYAGVECAILLDAALREEGQLSLPVAERDEAGVARQEEAA